MYRLQCFITALPFIIGGIFFAIYSKRLAIALLKSTMALNEAFRKKKEFSRNDRIIIQIFLILFGVLLFFGGTRLIIEALKN